MNLSLLRNKKPIFNKLETYGFVLKGELYLFETEIMDGAFVLKITIAPDGTFRFYVMDSTSGDEYTLIHNDDAIGAFVGAVRAECEKVIEHIVVQCFETAIFKSEQAQAIIAYIRQKYGVAAEFLWEKFPNNAIFRDPKTQKWFAALLTVDKRKLGIAETGTLEILDLRETSEVLTTLIDNKTYFPGYHMNKKHWYTLCLDGRLPLVELHTRIDKSFNTLKKKMTNSQ